MAPLWYIDMVRRHGTQTSSDRTKLPEWVRRKAAKWAKTDLPPGGDLPLSDKALARVFLRHWRHAMGMAPRTMVDQPLTVAQAAPWIDTPARTWEAWEAGMRLPPPGIWVGLNMLLRQATHGGNHVEDMPEYKPVPAVDAGPSAAPPEFDPETGAMLIPE